MPATVLRNFYRYIMPCLIMFSGLLLIITYAQVLCEAGEPVPDHLPVRRVGEVQPGAPGHGRHRRKLHPDPALSRPEDSGQNSVVPYQKSLG
jgi:hypothetical protein